MVGGPGTVRTLGLKYDYNTAGYLLTTTATGLQSCWTISDLIPPSGHLQGETLISAIERLLELNKL